MEYANCTQITQAEIKSVSVHEVMHFLECGHGDRFTKLMDSFMHDWRSRPDQLNDTPFAQVEWSA